MTKFYIKLVSLYLMPFTLRNIGILLDQSLISPQKVFTISPTEITYLMTLILAGFFLFSSYKSITNLHRKTIFIMTSLSFVFQMAVFSFEGKVSHSRAIIIFLILALNFFKIEEELFSEKNLTVHWNLRKVIFANYFLAGCFKVYSLFTHNIMESILIHSRAIFFFAWLEEERPMITELVPIPFIEKISPILLLFTILFQLSFLIPILYEKWCQTWALGILAFHFTNGIFMKIWFAPTWIGILLVFWLPEIIQTSPLSLSRFEKSP